MKSVILLVLLLLAAGGLAAYVLRQPQVRLNIEKAPEAEPVSTEDTQALDSFKTFLEGPGLYHEAAAKFSYRLKNPEPSDALMTLLAQETLNRDYLFFMLLNQESDFSKGHPLAMRTKDGKHPYILKIFYQEPEGAPAAVFDARATLKAIDERYHFESGSPAP